MRKMLNEYNVVLHIGVNVCAKNESDARKVAWEIAKSDLNMCFVDNDTVLLQENVEEDWREEE